MSAGLEVLKPGQVATVILAWRLDDPDVQHDGRFWIKLPSEGGDPFGRPPGTIIPVGQSLGYWRELCGGEAGEISNPVKGTKERISLRRWSEADPERTYVALLFEHRYETPRAPSAEERKRTRDAEASKPEPVKRLLPERARLQREHRAARDRDDEDELARLSATLAANAAELARADFPNYAGGWDLGRAIRCGPDRFVLDWTTEY